MLLISSLTTWKRKESASQFCSNESNFVESGGTENASYFFFDNSKEQRKRLANSSLMKVTLKNAEIRKMFLISSLTIVWWDKLRNKWKESNTLVSLSFHPLWILISKKGKRKRKTSLDDWKSLSNKNSQFLLDKWRFERKQTRKETKYSLTVLNSLRK